jgi:hypothetical protein
MLKTIAKLEIKLNERNYQFLCDNEAPLSDVKEVLFQFVKYAGQIEDAVKAQQEQKAKEESEKASQAPLEDKIEQIG